MMPFLDHCPAAYQLDDRTAESVQARCDSILGACDRKGLFDEAEIRSELALLMTRVPWPSKRRNGSRADGLPHRSLPQFVLGPLASPRHRAA
jgi:hypothetical protein